MPIAASVPDLLLFKSKAIFLAAHYFPHVECSWDIAAHIFFVFAKRQYRALIALNAVYEQ